MIFVITPNTAVDRTLFLPDQFHVGDVSRATETIIAAGGKGLNVARAIHKFGDAVLCGGFVGGHGGRHVAELTASEGLSATWTEIEPETRTCMIVISPHNNDATVFNEPGPTISEVDWARLKTDVAREAGHAACVCLCGSLPLGAPETAPADLITLVRDMGKPIWIDTSKTSLRQALTARPTGLKVNAIEAGEIVGRDVQGQESAFAVAMEFRGMGIETVVLTLGGDGAVMVTPEGGWWSRPPTAEIVSSVGSGDVFLAGLVTGLTANMTPDNALRRAVAAGTANALQAGGGSFSLDTFAALLAQTQVEPWHR